MTDTLLLINPWIYDFAAYDLWSKPLGLLTLAGALRERGFRVTLIDCLDPYHPGMDRPLRRKYGTGKFRRREVPRPQALGHVSRPYSRYGISRECFLKDLRGVTAPGAVLVTSLMTYWYPGVFEAIGLIKAVFPKVPVILGGVYARLCEEHALAGCGADHVVTVTDDTALPALLELLQDLGLGGGGRRPGARPPAYPAFDLLRKIDYVCIATSTGCPYRCRYCASRFLNPRYSQRGPQDILEEILYWHGRFGIKDFAFYDDALLIQSADRMGPVMERLARLKADLRFHTPNALHVREITPEISKLLYRSGFRTLRLGLESSSMTLHERLDRKLSEGDFERAVENLRSAGFENRDIGAYILAGLPGQSVDSVVDTIRFAASTGAQPYLAEYSPIPHTSLWEEAVRVSPYPIAAEPLYHNNTLWPCWPQDRGKGISEIKRLARDIRKGKGSG